jgi:hypothetical protein
MSDSSAENLLNQASETVEQAPTAEYEVMSDAYADAEKKEKTFGGDEDGLKRAAREVTEKRAEEKPVVERTYLDVNTGEKMPDNQTLSLDRAATDLERQRGFEQQERENVANAVTALETDAARAGVDLATFAQQQLQQQQAQAQTIQPQPVDPGVPPEVAELQAELERSPKLRQALEQDIGRIQQAHQAAEQTKQQYAAATQEAHAFAIQSMMASFPEFNGLSNPQQISAALQVLQQTNPQRHAAAVQHLARVDQLGKAHAAAQQQRQQQQAAQVRDWAIAQDRAMDDYLAKNESPEVVRSVKDNLGKVLATYGIDPREFGQVVSQVPMFRSAQVQRMLFDLCKTHVLRDEVAQKKVVPVPPVQRPGTSQPRASHSDAEIAAAREAFTKNPNPQAAAAYLMAKRSARS